jgi:protein-S-isoprenylcysteine O-methyltransferase Ste14
MSARSRGDLLVLAQFVLLALLLLPGPPAVRSAALVVTAVVLALIGTAVAAAGMWSLGRHLVPWVAPADGAALRTNGVFRWTRNPIYVGILVATAGWVLWRARPEIAAIWVALCIVLVTKAHVEQRHLLAAFGDEYRAYAARTPLLLGRRGIR